MPYYLVKIDGSLPKAGYLAKAKLVPERNIKSEDETQSLKIGHILDAMTSEICDNICKYAAAYPEEDQDFLIEEICPKCPLTKYL